VKWETYAQGKEDEEEEEEEDGIERGTTGAIKRTARPALFRALFCLSITIGFSTNSNILQ
jgi:hypothetical protein